MSTFFCITIRFLDAAYHGQRDGGEPEWPPSPLRLFQALLAASAARGHDGSLPNSAVAALTWLEKQTPPEIVAPSTVKGTKYRLYVPDNVADKVAKSWSGGGSASIADFRVEKDVCPLHLCGSDAVHFVWSLTEDNAEFGKHREVLFAAVRSITHLGWGVDMVAANATVISVDEAVLLKGEHWEPSSGNGAASLRVPVAGSFVALVRKHDAFLQRLHEDNFSPVPQLRAGIDFRTVTYRRDFEPQPLKFAAFSLLKPDASKRQHFSALRTHVLAGMVRHLTSNAASTAGWSIEDVKTYVQGHAPDAADGPDSQSRDAPRFSYLPLPSIQFRGEKKGEQVTDVIRLLVVEHRDGNGEKVAWARRTLSGQDLIDENTKEPKALLSLLPNDDAQIERFTKSASIWSTVTPVVLPRNDYGDSRKTAQLLRKALRQAGFSEVLAQHAELSWRNVGFWPGTDLATRYSLPSHLQPLPRYHVRIQWRDPSGASLDVPGPICIGGGRFCGLGLFASEESLNR